MNGPAMENLIFEWWARLHAINLQLISRLLPKHFSKNANGHCFFSDRIS